MWPAAQTRIICQPRLIRTCWAFTITFLLMSKHIDNLKRLFGKLKARYGADDDYVSQIGQEIDARSEQEAASLADAHAHPQAQGQPVPALHSVKAGHAAPQSQPIRR